MSLQRWEPLREMMTLREAMDRMFDDALIGRGRRGEDRSLAVPVDIVERDDEVIVRAPVPGFDPDQIDVSIQSDCLTVRGSVEAEEERDEEHVHVREWRAGSFSRTVRLPANIRGDAATAEFKNGVLTVHLPKAEEEISRRIEVRGD